MTTFVTSSPSTSRRRTSPETSPAYTFQPKSPRLTTQAASTTVEEEEGRSPEAPCVFIVGRALFSSHLFIPPWCDSSTNPSSTSNPCPRNADRGNTLTPNTQLLDGECLDSRPLIVRRLRAYHNMKFHLNHDQF